MSSLKKTNCKNTMLNTLLNQGKVYLRLQDNLKYLVDPHLKLIEETTGPKLGSLSLENFRGSIKEGLDNNNSSSSSNCTLPTISGATSGDYPGMVDMSKNNQQFMKDCTKKYNTLLSQWNSLTQGSNLLAKSSADKSAQKALAAKAEQVNTEMLQFLTQLNKVVGSQIANKQGITGTPSGYPTHHVDSWNNIVTSAGALRTQRKQYDNIVNSVNTSIADEVDSGLRTRSAYLQFMVWGIVAITMLGYSLKLHL